MLLQGLVRCAPSQGGPGCLSTCCPQERLSCACGPEAAKLQGSRKVGSRELSYFCQLQKVTTSWTWAGLQQLWCLRSVQMVESSGASLGRGC